VQGLAFQEGGDLDDAWHALAGISMRWRVRQSPSPSLIDLARPPLLLVQKVPEPTVHAVLQLGAGFANLKQTRCIIFQESCSRDELEGRPLERTGYGRMLEDEIEGSLQTGGIGYF
jgi:hypothetical protein